MLTLEWYKLKNLVIPNPLLHRFNVILTLNICDFTLLNLICYTVKMSFPKDCKQAHIYEHIIFLIENLVQRWTYDGWTSSQVLVILASSGEVRQIFW